MKRSGWPVPGTGLFQNEDKSPMVFCLRPCSIKKVVKGHIVKGGGLCFQSILKVPLEYRDRAIILMPNDETRAEKNALNANYVIDSAREGMLLPKESYSRRPEITDEREGDGIGRLAYSESEDKNILLYIQNQGVKSSLQLSGNSFWRRLEKQNMFQLRGRSWQSLKDRYMKHLKGRELEYPHESLSVGQLPMPREEGRAEHSPKQSSPRMRSSRPPPLDIPVQYGKDIDVELQGSFLAEVEGRRNALSPGLSQREYHILIKDFVTSMEKLTKIHSKSIHKVLFKCNGNEDVAKHYLLHGRCPEGFHMFSDDEDKILLKCLLNPTICDEGPAQQLAGQLGGQAVLDRAAALLGITRSDFNYMRSISLTSLLKVENGA